MYFTYKHWHIILNRLIFQYDIYVIYLYYIYVYIFILYWNMHDYGPNSSNFFSQLHQTAATQQPYGAMRIHAQSGARTSPMNILAYHKSQIFEKKRFTFAHFIYPQIVWLSGLLHSCLENHGSQPPKRSKIYKQAGVIDSHEGVRFTGLWYWKRFSPHWAPIIHGPQRRTAVVESIEAAMSRR